MSIFDKFTSFDQLLKSAVTTFGRFPFTLLSAAIGTAVSIFMVENASSNDLQLPQRLLMAAALGLPLFTALVLFGEKRNWSRFKILTLQGAGAAALVGYFFTLPADISFESIHSIRFMLLNSGLHLLVAILPYLGGKETPGFWNYNKSLFLRFLIAALYSGVLYTGLSIALASADQLFGIDVDNDRYVELWIIIAVLFNTWFFLAGVPANLAQLETMDDYPKGLKVFTQYILLPLVTLYVVILFAYEAKIIVTWNWPVGWVSNLVLWYSVVGIFSLLILHPLRKKTENKWILVFSRWFFRALIPLVVLLFLAILRRISDYGITENRYFVVVMAIGLAIVVLYFVISKVRDIRIIPIVICCIAFLSAFGPWGAFAVSLKSQQNRLERLLIENNLLSDGVVQESSKDIPFDDRKEMSSIIDYLEKWHGLESFSSWIYPDSLNGLVSLNNSKQKENLASLMGFDYFEKWIKINQGTPLMYDRLSTANSILVSGYDYYLKYSNYNNNIIITPVSIAIKDSITYRIDTTTYELGSVTVLAWNDTTFTSLLIQIGDSNQVDNVLRLPIADELKAWYDTVSVDSILTHDRLTLSGTTPHFDAKVIVVDVNGWMKTDMVELFYLEAQLLLRIH